MIWGNQNNEGQDSRDSPLQEAGNPVIEEVNNVIHRIDLVNIKISGDKGPNLME